MNKDDIIRLARQAGAVFPSDGSWHRFEIEELVAFANLVEERGQMDALNKACVMLRQVHDSFLLSSKPSQLNATQVRIKT